MFSKSSVSQALIDATKAIMEASDKKLLLEPSKKMPDAAKVPERVQAAISKKQDDRAAASGNSSEVREAAEKDSPFNWRNKPSQLNKKPGESAGFDSKKISTGTVYTKKFKKDKEEVKEEKFDPLKHIKNPSPAVKAASKDVKRGSYADRAALMKAGGVKDDRGPRGVTQEEVKEEKFDPLKHIKNPSPAVKAAAKDVKRGSYADRAALMKAGGVKDDRGPRGVTQEEAELDERTLTPGETSEKERIVKGMKKSLSGFKARYGDRAKNVMYATATKQAMKEEEELDEVLKGKQHKLDKNRNGKLDKQDFEILRKEDIGGISTMSEKKKEVKEEDDKQYTHQVVHSKTGNVIGKYTSLKAAHRAADKKDAAFGAVAHRVVPLAVQEAQEVEDAEYVRMEPNEDMKTKTVDTLAGRKKVPADYHNQTKSYKVKLNVTEGKGTDVDPNFVTNESTPLKMAKDIAKKSFKKIRNEMLGMAGATSEEKKNDK